MFDFSLKVILSGITDTVSTQSTVIHKEKEEEEEERVLPFSC